VGTRPKISADAVGVELASELRGWLDEMPAQKVTECLIGGIATQEVPSEWARYMARLDGAISFIVPPLPNIRPIRHATPDELLKMQFAAGSMAPKVEAACEFARSAVPRPGLVGCRMRVQS
jgi:hypothetical protein